MKKIALVTLAALALFACKDKTETPPPAEQPAQPAATATANKTVTYSCENGETLQVAYLNDKESAVLTRGEDQIELPMQRAGSGFSYGDAKTSIRGKGDEMTLIIGKMAPIQCKAQ